MSTILNTSRPDLPADYYLHNFNFMLEWIANRYSRLLTDQETLFIATFKQLACNSQRLLVRLVSRKGPFFRSDKLNYSEIPDLYNAARQLHHAGLIQINPSLSISSLGNILTKPELLELFKSQLHDVKKERKEVLLELLTASFPEDKTWTDWIENNDQELYYLDLQPMMDTFLILFFGNAHQNLTEFVLSDLGLFKYENYQIDSAHQVFKSRIELDGYKRLIELRSRLEVAETLLDLESLVNDLPSLSKIPSLERRYGNLINQLGYELERRGELEAAYHLYCQTDLPPARERKIRILEKQGAYQEAWHLLNQCRTAPSNEHEMQIVERMLPRLAKKVGEKLPKPIKASPAPELFLTLPPLADESGYILSVEETVRQHYSQENPCFYVENTLFCGLLGLWLWPALFASVDGAFANPFQAAPLDLYQEDFISKRQNVETLYRSLEEGTHIEAIKESFQNKHGITNHFVNWDFLSEDLLNLALTCVPGNDLKLIFQRILFDIKSNRSGLPDLIQFIPSQNSYKLIEVKGPGDRLQDNQIRWLNYFSKHGIAAEVCYVSWT